MRSGSPRPRSAAWKTCPSQYAELSQELTKTLYQTDKTICIDYVTHNKIIAAEYTPALFYKTFYKIMSVTLPHFFMLIPCLYPHKTGIHRQLLFSVISALSQFLRSRSEVLSALHIFCLPIPGYAMAHKQYWSFAAFHPLRFHTDPIFHGFSSPHL